MNTDFYRFKTEKYLEITKDFLEKRYGLKFHQEGAGYVTYCPFHDDKKPSFVLSCKSYQGRPEEVRLHCFGQCTLPRVDIDIFDFVQRKDKCGSGQAYRKVEEYFGKVATVLSPSPTDSKYPPVKVKKTNSRQDREDIIPIVTRAANIYHQILLTCQDSEVEEARAYLRRRGVDEDLMKEFRIGYAPKLGSRVKGLAWYFKDDFHKNYPLYEKSGLFTRLVGVKSRWINKNYYIKGPAAYYGDFLSRRIIFPLYDEELRIVSLTGRKVAKISLQYRYKMLPGTPKNSILYGYKKAKLFLPTARNFTIVEGPLDLLAWWKKYPSNAHSVVVACLGNDFSDQQQKLLFKAAPIWKKNPWRITIYVFFDQGAEAKAAAIVHRLQESQLLKDVKVRIHTGLLPTDSEDPDDFFKKHLIQGPLFTTIFSDFEGSPAVLGSAGRSLNIPSAKEKDTRTTPAEYPVDKNKLTDLLLKGEKITSKPASKKRVEKIVNFIKSDSSKEGAKETIGIPAPLVDPKYTEKTGVALVLLLHIWIRQRGKGRRVVTTAKKETEMLGVSTRAYHNYRRKLEDLGFLVWQKRGQKSIFSVRF